MGNRFDLIDVFELMKQLLAALDYSHRQGVVHRDIKPANLMILHGPKVKVMDFGIARLDSSSLTQVGTVVGTPTHMSPEQLMGLTADGRVDIWSSGVILYELLTGVTPFHGETPAAVMHKVLQAEPVKPSQVKPGIPEGFDIVVARALAKKPEERFQSAREFQATLLLALHGKPVSATPGPARRADPTRTLTALEAAQLAVAPGPAPTATAISRAPALAIEPEALAEIERSLSRHMGPLAKLLVQRSQKECASIEEFFRVLAENIPNDDEQAEFMRKMTALKKGERTDKTGKTTVGGTMIQAPRPQAGSTMSVFKPEVLAAAERQLASYVGPLARVLIKEAAGKSGNIKELYTQLAAHIDSEEERRDFLASLPR
jgi:serine/threonine-protein kinase